MMSVKISAQPIGWTNDDIHDLGGDTPLEKCLSDMKEAGYEGTELGRKFPREPEKLKAALRPYGLALASGWHDVLLLSKGFDEEERKLRTHLEFLKAMGSVVAVVAECSQNLYGPPDARMRRGSQGNGLSAGEWRELCRGFEKLAQSARSLGMRLAYHHHMGTLVQNRDEVDKLMRDTSELALLVDTGHAAYAEMDPLALARAHRDRVAHVHLKDVRRPRLDQALRESWSFEKSVREGVFTVPGDGGIDYAPFFGLLDEAGYRGWLVVEAEQDPEKAEPLEYARKGRDYLRRMLASPVGRG